MRKRGKKEKGREGEQLLEGGVKNREWSCDLSGGKPPVGGKKRGEKDRGERNEAR